LKVRRGNALGDSVVGEDGDDVKELYITQRLDHFDTTNEATFQQRYFVSYRHHSDGSSNGNASQRLPIISLLCTGGEGPGFTKSVLIDSVHCSGDMLELAKRIAQTKTHDVVLYALEHRYYGKSYPDFEDAKTGNQTSPLTVENLHFLSSRQALEDLAHFVHAMNQDTSTDDDEENAMNTWVTFGGSYPGMMSMYARYKYPHLIFASVSSSAPLQLRVDFPGYKTRQGWDLKYDKIGGSDECHRIVKAGHDQAVTLVQQTGNKTNSTDDGSVVLSKKFNVCKPDTALRKRRNQELFLGDGLINIMSQGNDPSCTEGDLCNIAGLCRFMVQQVEEMKAGEKLKGIDGNNVELEVLAKVAQKQNQFEREQATKQNGQGRRERRQQKRQITTKELSSLGSFQQYDDDCINIDYNDMVAFLSSEVVEPSGTRSWIWQTCTEFGFYSTCNDNCPFASHFHSVDLDLEICFRLFNITSDNVYENVQSSIDLYGGKKFLDSGASNILTVNGNVDPWSVLGLEESDSTNYLLPVKMVEGASHHFWTHAVKDTDAIEIIKIREYIYSCVMTWLGIEYSVATTNDMNSNGDDWNGSESEDENRLWLSYYY
jgi:serine protease 16